MTMVVGVFESLVNAEDAVADLVASGYSRSAIRVFVRDSVSDPTGDNDRSQRPRGKSRTSVSTPKSRCDMPAGVPPNEPGKETEPALAGSLEASGLAPAAARFFADAICNGAVLVAVRCTSPRAGDARDILDIYNDSPEATRGPMLM